MHKWTYVGVSVLVSGLWSLKNACGSELNLQILVRQPEEGGQERIGYLSSCVVWQPKHTFFCLSLGRAYHSISTTWSQEQKVFLTYSNITYVSRNGCCSWPYYEFQQIPGSFVFFFFQKKQICSCGVFAVFQQVWDVVHHGQHDRFKVLTPDPWGSVCSTWLKSEQRWSFWHITTLLKACASCSWVLPIPPHLSTSVNTAPAGVF